MWHPALIWSLWLVPRHHIPPITSYSSPGIDKIGSGGPSFALVAHCRGLGWPLGSARHWRAGGLEFPSAGGNAN